MPANPSESDDVSPQIFHCQPTAVFRALTMTAVLLIGISVGLQIVSTATGHDSMFGLRQKFDLSRERTIPAFFSSTMLLVSGVLLLVMAACHRRGARPYPRLWQTLGAIFIYLAADEMVGFHEMLNGPMKRVVPGRGPLYYTWVAAGLPAVVTLAAVYWRALAALPATIRRQVVLAGSLYVGGAIGFEMLGGWYISQHSRDLTYHMISTLEESLEMFGVITFIHALLKYLGARYPEIHVQISASEGVKSGELVLVDAAR